MLTEKQMVWLDSLWKQITLYAASNPLFVDTAELEEVFDTVDRIDKGNNEITKAQFDKVLVAFQNVLATRPVARWHKHGEEWLIKGHPSLVQSGETIIVVSRKGEQEIVVGDIVGKLGDDIVARPYVAPAKEGSFTATEEGFYWRDGNIIEAAKTKKGILVAHLIGPDNKRKEYLGKKGLVNVERKLTVEEIKESGKETSNCLICHKILENEESLRFGIGPTCRAKLGI